jgi:hypothetical protein
VTFRRAAGALTAFRALCGLILPVRPSLALLLVGVITDWVDGPLARRAGSLARGARDDAQADSLLTLGAAIAAVRRGAPPVVLLAPIAHYALAPARHPDDVRWDRFTGVAQMALLGAAIARLPIAWPATFVTAPRCAALLARQGRAR